MTPEETKLIRVSAYLERHPYRFGLAVPATVLLARVPAALGMGAAAQSVAGGVGVGREDQRRPMVTWREKHLRMIRISTGQSRTSARVLMMCSRPECHESYMFESGLTLTSVMEAANRHIDDTEGAEHE